MRTKSCSLCGEENHEEEVWSAKIYQTVERFRPLNYFPFGSKITGTEPTWHFFCTEEHRESWLEGRLV